MQIRRSTTLSLLFWVLGVVSAFISDQVQGEIPRIHTEETDVTNKLTFEYAKGNIKVLPKEIEKVYKPKEVRCFNRHAYMEGLKPSWNCHDQGSSEEKLFLASAYKIECTRIRASASEHSKDRFDPESCNLSMTYRLTALGQEKYPSGE
ncbi:MAG: hypothetical protein Q9185_003601 [Variospora sp. 1 TL-2023]